MVLLIPFFFFCSFKTKGNLTKHMKSKSHYKKCTELGLNPVPVHVDDDGADIDIEGDQQSISSERTSTIPGDSDTATDSDGDDTDDSGKCLLIIPLVLHKHLTFVLFLIFCRGTEEPFARARGCRRIVVALDDTSHVGLQ